MGERRGGREGEDGVGLVAAVVVVPEGSEGGSMEPGERAWPATCTRKVFLERGELRNGLGGRFQLLFIARAAVASSQASQRPGSQALQEFKTLRDRRVSVHQA
jgi:hypothetical protein